MTKLVTFAVGVVFVALLACKKSDDSSAASTEKAKASSPTLDDTYEPRKQAGTKLPWKSGDFENEKLAYEDTGVASCNAMLNACFACRKRLSSESGDVRLSATTTELCRRYRAPFKEMGSDKAAMKTKCDSILKEMKDKPDCVVASWEALKQLKGK